MSQDNQPSDRQPTDPQSPFRFPSSLPNLWQEMESRVNQWMGKDGETGLTVSEDAQKVYVEAQVPGLSSNDLDISLHQNTLIIKGEKKKETASKDRKFYRTAKSSFFYQLDLPAAVEESSEEAVYQEGVLKLSFKKSKPTQIRKISVEKSTQDPYDTR